MTRLLSHDKGKGMGPQVRKWESLLAAEVLLNMNEPSFKHRKNKEKKLLSIFVWCT